MKNEEISDRIELNISKITIVLSEGIDKIYLHTDLPCAFSYLSNEETVLQFDATYDTAKNYVKTYFNIEPKIINLRNK